MELEAASRDHPRESCLNNTGDTASLTGQKANVTPVAQAGGVRMITDFFLRTKNISGGKCIYLHLVAQALTIL